jgi:putative ABC transport system permease protein
MLTRFCRLLLLAFPVSLRTRLGRPLLQTLVTDSRGPSGRLSPRRLLVNGIDIVRSGAAERLRARSRAGADGGAPRGRWSIATDLRHVRRSLARRRGFAVAVFTTLALGLGVNTAIFSVVNSVLLTELPYRAPSRLAFLWTKLAWIGVPRAWVAGPHIDRLAREARTIDRILPLRTAQVQLHGGAFPELVQAGLTTAPLFEVLGVRPMLGRGFVTDDEPRAAAILTHALWQRRYGADPAIVGRTIDVDGDPTEVLGVLPPDFRFQVHASLGDPKEVDLWLPTRWKLAQMSDGSFGFAALVRVRDDATVGEAQAELDVIGARLDRERYQSHGFGWQLVGVQEDLVSKTRPVLWLLAAGACVVLLVGCANIAGLMLVRAADRQREFAIRAALGASGRAVVRLVVLECLVLSLVAGAAGVAIAWAATRALVAAAAVPIPRLAEVAVDWRVMAFELVLSIVTGLVFSAAPALRAARADLSTAMKDASRGSSGRAGRLRGALVAAEIALAVMLVAGSVLLLRSYAAARRVDPGFARDGVLTAGLTLTRSRYPTEAHAIDFFRRLIDRLAAAEGVDAVGGTSSPPLGADTDQTSVKPDGWVPPTPRDTSILSDLFRVTPGAFEALGMALVAGREVSWQDRAGGELVTLVDERFARAAWPGADPLGRRVSLDGGPPVTVIGVVRHARQYAIEADDRPQIYRPYAQDPTATLTMAMRTTGDPERLAGLLARTVHDLDPNQPIAAITTMRQVVDQALSGRRLQLETVGGFAMAALVLCALGVYGLVSSFVGERTREIAIRLALGASRAAVRRLIVGRIFALAIAGVGVGTMGALAISRALAHFLFSVTADDPLSLVATAAILVITTGISIAWPIHRALAIAPTRALGAD